MMIDAVDETRISSICDIAVDSKNMNKIPKSMQQKTHKTRGIIKAIPTFSLSLPSEISDSSKGKIINTKNNANDVLTTFAILLLRGI
ncbi:hypothetical protein TSUD_246880 [Trifolium subterraneum]|uniref:Uncharacterized protein n=1 Tax=Trifolium subterraneum TaxID=3900 RepID=A0A2Z6NES3_TRISU|nr:hypothetical protein TSUD_246880 [Trifolium subterraneum]